MKRITTQILCMVSLFTVFSPAADAADPLLHNRYGVDLLEEGKIEQGIEQLEQAYRLYSADQTLKKNLATAYALMGQKLLDKKSYPEAASQFEKSIELFPDDPQYHLLRGISFTLAKNVILAQYELQQARKLGGDSAESLYFLGRLHYDAGETDEALEFWEKATAMAPSDPFLSGLMDKMRREQLVEAKMERGHSSRFIVSYDTEEVKTDIALAVLDVLEQIYNGVGTDLSCFPEARVPVILYTKRDYREVTRSPGWSGGLYDGKIRLPIGGIVEITPDLRGTLRHEYTHAVVREISKGNCPVWLNEGIAELQGRLEFNTPLRELEKAVGTGEFIPLQRLGAGFAAPGTAEVHLAYEQSYALVNYMVATYGWHRMRIILANLGEGLPIDKAVAGGLNDLGLNLEGVFDEWKAYMVREFGEKRG